VKGVLILSVFVQLGFSSITFADGEKDNSESAVRPVPPPGIAVPDDVRASLTAGLAALEIEIATVKDPERLMLLPDVAIYAKAVRVALTHGEFYKPKEFDVAKVLLEQGMRRVSELKEGKPSWTGMSGLVARGYESKIDGSVQPYGLVVPDSYQAKGPHRYRLDCWFHGRGEKLSELDFIRQRQTSPGQFTPEDTIVLHLYGRYCNANKLAGEIDLLEALEKVKEQYRIDEDRVLVRGFSMGGAACWQFAVHYPGRWAAAAPGAGFSETPDFLKVFQNETLRPTWFEKKLWHMYDCTDWAINLAHCPTVAYSGEIDKQKQAADVMETALEKEGIGLVHLIGEGMGHKYHPDTKKELERRIDAIAAQGRDRVPKRIRFTTWTLRYPTMRWISVNGMGEHWERARVDAEILEGKIAVKTSNVTALTIDLPPGQPHLDMVGPTVIEIDGVLVDGGKVQSDGSFRVHLEKSEAVWKRVSSSPSGLTKRPGLQGPIDDAFMDSFLMVAPSGDGFSEKSKSWVDAEMAHAVNHWRKQFRGVARQKIDTEVTEEDITAHNLVLWGDPSSNAVMEKLMGRLPIQWRKDAVTVGSKTYASESHVPVLIYPNPLNPEKYVVFNSGFTFREYDYLNNARQVPKLPDWAIIDISQPVTSRWPGGIADAGFFGEKWELKTRKGRD
jgi:dienelactone hydrolase